MLHKHISTGTAWKEEDTTMNSLGSGRMNNDAATSKPYMRPLRAYDWIAPWCDTRDTIVKKDTNAACRRTKAAASLIQRAIDLQRQSKPLCKDSDFSKSSGRSIIPTETRQSDYTASTFNDADCSINVDQEPSIVEQDHLLQQQLEIDNVCKEVDKTVLLSCYDFSRRDSNNKKNNSANVTTESDCNNNDIDFDKYPHDIGKNSVNVLNQVHLLVSLLQDTLCFITYNSVDCSIENVTNENNDKRESFSSPFSKEICSLFIDSSMRNICREEMSPSNRTRKNRATILSTDTLTTLMEVAPIHHSLHVVCLQYLRFALTVDDDDDYDCARNKNSKVDPKQKRKDSMGTSHFNFDDKDKINKKHVTLRTLLQSNDYKTCFLLRQLIIIAMETLGKGGLTMAEKSGPIAFNDEAEAKWRNLTFDTLAIAFETCGSQWILDAPKPTPSQLPNFSGDADQEPWNGFHRHHQQLTSIFNNNVQKDRDYEAAGSFSRKDNTAGCCVSIGDSLAVVFRLVCGEFRLQLELVAAMINKFKGCFDFDFLPHLELDGVVSVNATNDVNHYNGQFGAVKQEGLHSVHINLVVSISSCRIMLATMKQLMKLSDSILSDDEQEESNKEEETNENRRMISCEVTSKDSNWSALSSDYKSLLHIKDSLDDAMDACFQFLTLSAKEKVFGELSSQPTPPGDQYDDIIKCIGVEVGLICCRCIGAYLAETDLEDVSSPKSATILTGLTGALMLGQLLLDEKLPSSFSSEQRLVGWNVVSSLLPGLLSIKAAYEETRAIPGPLAKDGVLLKALARMTEEIPSQISYTAKRKLSSESLTVRRCCRLLLWCSKCDTYEEEANGYKFELYDYLASCAYVLTGCVDEKSILIKNDRDEDRDMAFSHFSTLCIVVRTWILMLNANDIRDCRRYIANETLVNSLKTIFLAAPEICSERKEYIEVVQQLSTTLAQFPHVLRSKV